MPFLSLLRVVSCALGVASMTNAGGRWFGRMHSWDEPRRLKVERGKLLVDKDGRPGWHDLFTGWRSLELQRGGARRIKLARTPREGKHHAWQRCRITETER